MTTTAANTKYKVANFQPGHRRSTHSIKQKSMKEPSLIFKLHSSGLNALSKAYFPVMAGEAAATVFTDAAITNPVVEAQAAQPALVAAARPPITPPHLFIRSSPPPIARRRPVAVAAVAEEEVIPLQRLLKFNQAAARKKKAVPTTRTSASVDDDYLTFIRVIPTAEEQIPCDSEKKCSNNAAVSWSSNSNCILNLCEGCQVNDNGGWPEGIQPIKTMAEGDGNTQVDTSLPPDIEDLEPILHRNVDCYISGLFTSPEKL